MPFFHETFLLITSNFSHSLLIFNQNEVLPIIQQGTSSMPPMFDLPSSQICFVGIVSPSVNSASSDQFDLCQPSNDSYNVVKFLKTNSSNFESKQPFRSKLWNTTLKELSNNFKLSLLLETAAVHFHLNLVSNTNGKPMTFTQMEGFYMHILHNNEALLKPKMYIYAWKWSIITRSRRILPPCCNLAAHVASTFPAHKKQMDVIYLMLSSFHIHDSQICSRFNLTWLCCFYVSNT